MSNPLLNALNGATDMVDNLPIDALSLGGNKKTSMTNMVANIKKHGTLPANAFSLEIHASAIADDPNARLYYTCESFSWPSRRFSTQEVQHGGIKRRIPYSQDYAGEFAVSFRVGKDMYERKMFEDWQKLIYDEDNAVWGYYADYVGTLVIRQYDRSNGNVYGDKFTEVYPTAIESFDASQSDKDVIKQNIVFAYRKWERLKDTELLDPPSGNLFGIPLVDGFIGGDLENLITGSMNLASAVNTKISQVDQAVQQNVGFIRKAVNGDVVLAPFKNVGKNLNQTISQYSGSNFPSI